LCLSFLSRLFCIWLLMHIYIYIGVLFLAHRLNDILWSRFQALRNLVPQNDQKRDKASFLLEVNRSTFFFFFLNSWIYDFFLNHVQVIEYVQFLQDKLQIYEGSYEGWSQEPAKLLPRVNFRSWTFASADYCFS
jgi:hypothetical protein